VSVATSVTPTTYRLTTAWPKSPDVGVQRN
jgi:hypothetical protein